jgi:hypothetical protein
MVSKINEGDVTISLNGEDIVLRPTLKALSAISSNGGLGVVRQQIVDQNFSTITSVIIHGANLAGMRGGKDVPEAVFKNGLSTELLVGLLNYVGVLGNGGNGGKPQPDDVAAAAAEAETETESGNGS